MKGIDIEVLLNVIKASIVITDTRGCVFSVTSEAERLFGLSGDVVIGKEIFEFLSDESAAGIAEMLDAILESGSHWTGQVIVRASEGHKTPVTMTCSPVRANGSEMSGFVFTFHDDLIQKELELEKNRVLETDGLKNDSTCIGSWEIFPETEKIFIDETLRQILSVPADCGTDFWEILDQFPVDAKAKIEESMQRTMLDGESFEIELPFRNADGEMMWLRTNGVAELSDGIIVRAVGSVEDITEHRRNEIRLLVSEEKLRNVFDNVHMLVVIIGRNGEIVYLNDYFLSLAGYHIDEVLGRDFFELFISKQEYRAVKGVFHSAIAGSSFPQHFENNILLRDGCSRVIKWSNTVFRGADGQPESVTSLGEDITETRAANKALEESEERFRTVIRKSADAIYLHSMDGRIVLFNENSMKSLGYTEDELKNLFVWDISTRITGPEDAARYWRKPAIGDSILLESGHRKKDGSVFPVEVNLTKIFLNNCEHILAAARDITVRKSFEKSLFESETKYRMLFENAPDAHFIIDLDGRFIEGNRMAEIIIGYKLTELQGRKLSETGLFPSEFSSKASRIIGKNAQGLSTGPEEFVLNRKDGTQVRTEITTFPVDIDGNRYIMGIVRDVTFRYDAERKIEKERAYYRSFLDSLSEWAWEMDVKGIHTYSNPAIKEILGYEVEEIVGFSSTKLWPDSSKTEKLLNLFYRDLTRGTGWKDYPAHFQHKDGTRRILESTAIPIHDEDGNLKGYRGIDRDITERVQSDNRRMELEAQLLQAQKMETIGTLAGGIAHDFNNLLTPILGYSEMALLDIDEPELLRDELNQVRRSAEKARNLVRQLLVFSRKIDDNREAVVLNDVLRESIHLLRASIPATIEIRMNLTEDLLIVFADSGQLSQVIMNIATNAFQAMEHGGRLTIELHRREIRGSDLNLQLDTGTYAEILFRDTGKGIDAGSLERIFDPFFTTKSKNKGTGLGLSVVHGIVKNHNGIVTADSVFGKGTTFTVYLPLSGGDASRSDITELPLRPGRGNILVVDDVAPNRKLFTTMLQRIGYTVFTASDGEYAIELLRLEKIDLVLSDITMPRLTGYELAAKIREEISPDLPVILMTGFSENVKNDRFDVEILMKPISIRMLGQKIQQHLIKKEGGV